jgi:hypothetical protein
MEVTTSVHTPLVGTSVAGRVVQSGLATPKSPLAAMVLTVRELVPELVRVMICDGLVVLTS